MNKEAYWEFCVRKSRCRVIRLEMFYWRKEDVMKMSECFVILNNLIVRMSQNGVFEIEDGMENVDVVTEFTDDDDGDLDGNCAIVVDDDGLTGGLDWGTGEDDALEASMVHLEVVEGIMASQVGFWKLREGLVKNVVALVFRFLNGAPNSLFKCGKSQKICPPTLLQLCRRYGYVPGTIYPNTPDVYTTGPFDDDSCHLF